MEKICAIIDAQGFYLRNKFYPRELAFVSDSYSHCQEFNPNIPWGSLTEREVNTVRHIRYRVNGLSLNTYKNRSDVVPTSDQYIVCLNKWYQMLATDDKPFFAVKNKMLYDDILEAALPVIDLSDPKYNMPSTTQIERLYNSDWLCAYHCKGLNAYQVYRCALRKCQNIWSYIKSLAIHPNAIKARSEQSLTSKSITFKNPIEEKMEIEINKQPKIAIPIAYKDTNEEKMEVDDDL